MKTSASDRSFARGLACLKAGDPLEALAYFEASLRLEEKTPNPARRSRFASYYGYCLALALGRRREGLSICRRAAESDFFTPDVMLNLARVHLLAGSRKEAWDALMKGLSVDPQHAELREEIRKMGVRKRPVIPFLERAHPLNKAAGRLRQAAVAEPQPTGRRRRS